MTLTTQGDAPIHYTLDGSEPTAASPRYTGPVEIGKAPASGRRHCARAARTLPIRGEFAFSKSTGRPAVLNTKPNDSYTFEGGFAAGRRLPQPPGLYERCLAGGIWTSRST